MKKIFIFLIIIIIFLLTYMFLFFSNEKLVKNINKDKIQKHISSSAIPIIENKYSYIEEQTKIWINRRENNQSCYGLLEKDKIVMAKWIKALNIEAPKIHLYKYHTDFTQEDLLEIALNNKEKNFIIKITHLQSNYGIIMLSSTDYMGEEERNKYLDNIYQQILERFTTSFVCNHDKNNPPVHKEIYKRKKESYYKLYETIEPGIIIQDFFYSYGDKKIKPIEFKILCFGGNILNRDLKILFIGQERMKYVYNFAKEISNKLGSGLIRVDVFVKNTDYPYIPYLNEISLSPNGGFYKSSFINFNIIDKYLKEAKELEVTDNEFVENLLLDVPKRSIPIKKYLTDAEKCPEKFVF